MWSLSFLTNSKGATWPVALDDVPAGIRGADTHREDSCPDVLLIAVLCHQISHTAAVLGKQRSRMPFSLHINSVKSMDPLGQSEKLHTNTLIYS